MKKNTIKMMEKILAKVIESEKGTLYTTVMYQPKRPKTLTVKAHETNQ